MARKIYGFRLKYDASGALVQAGMTLTDARTAAQEYSQKRKNKAIEVVHENGGPVLGLFLNGRDVS